MALINVTKAVDQQLINVNRDMTVTVDLRQGSGGASTFSVYWTITRGGVVVGGYKAVADNVVTFDLLKNDIVTSRSGGTGQIQVTIT